MNTFLGILITTITIASMIVPLFLHYIRELKTAKNENEFLRAENQTLDRKLRNLSTENENLNKTIEEMRTVEQNMPADCIKGNYCAACEFARTFTVNRGWSTRTIYVCNKGSTCKEFIARKETIDD